VGVKENAVMANDRVMIKCEGCGAWKMLLKHYPGTLATWDNQVLEWIDSHGQCHPRLYEMNLDGNPGFSLHTEGSPELDPDKQNAPPPKEEIT
jgi:hypothetical protein